MYNNTFLFECKYTIDIWRDLGVDSNILVHRFEVLVYDVLAIVALIKETKVKNLWQKMNIFQGKAKIIMSS